MTHRSYHMTVTQVCKPTVLNITPTMPLKIEHALTSEGEKRYGSCYTVAGHMPQCNIFLDYHASKCKHFVMYTWVTLSSLWLGHCVTLLHIRCAQLF